MGKQTAWEEIDRKAAEILDASDQIWGCAETAFTEHKSMQVLCEVLKKEGFEVEEGLAGVETAFKGTFGSGKGRCIFRAGCGNYMASGRHHKG